MELFLALATLAAIALVAAVASRWVTDSRDYADWRPSNGGFRRSPREG